MYAGSRLRMRRAAGCLAAYRPRAALDPLRARLRYAPLASRPPSIAMVAPVMKEA